MKISIIVPTYNEAQSVPILIEKIKKYFKSLKKYSYEVIIIDDNSPDFTASIVENKYKNDKSIRVYLRKKEKGLGTAIGYGIKKAKGKVIIGIDADGNHDVKKIGPLLRQLDNYDLVVASRYLRKVILKNINNQLVYLGSFLFNLFIKFFLGFPIWDNTSGFYAIKKNKLKSLGINRIYYGYGDYHLRLVYFAKLKNLQIKEIPCIFPKRFAGESKSKLLTLFFSYLNEVIKLRF